MFKRLKFRLYPDIEQKELIAKHIGSSRFVYNLALETKVVAYSGTKHNLSSFDLITQLPELKKECLWLKDVNSQSLQQAIRNMDVAFKGFFRGGGFPKYKTKHIRQQSFSVPQNVFLDIKMSRLFVPKFKKKGIKIIIHREIKGTIKSATISRTPTGKYFASLLVNTHKEKPVKLPIKESTTIGVDLGIKTFLVTSNGLEVENPKNLRKAQSKLKYIQRKYSKNKGKRTKQRLTLLHEKVANKRKDFLHKVSTTIIENQDTICLETLNVKGMLKNHNLAQAITDVSWSMFVGMLKYKADWRGKNILRIGQFVPSSKRCSNCGNIKKDLKLSDRTYNCDKCDYSGDRDLNAAYNIKYLALKNMTGEHSLKNQEKLPTVVGALIPEIHIT